MVAPAFLPSRCYVAGPVVEPWPARAGTPQRWTVVDSAVSSHIVTREGAGFRCSCQTTRGNLETECRHIRAVAA